MLLGVLSDALMQAVIVPAENLEDGFLFSHDPVFAGSIGIRLEKIQSSLMICFRFDEQPEKDR